MSEEILAAFMDKFHSDVDFQDKLKSAASPEAAVAIAENAGLKISTEELFNLQDRFKELRNTKDVLKQDLTDQELEFLSSGEATMMCVPPGDSVGG